MIFGSSSMEGVRYRKLTLMSVLEGAAMRMDDMILVSVDDHMIEPPDMYENHVPAKWKDQAPKVVRNERGVDEWVFQGEKTSTSFGMAATVGWPPVEWGFNPGAYTELRPGCFDVHERVRDMNANGVLASMCFPTMAGFNARTFTEGGDKELSLVMLQAYNDWHIDEWCAAYPGRFIPPGIVPMWDLDRHFQNQSWIDNSFGEGKLPSDVFREHFLACYITDPSGLKLRHEIGVDLIAWECDYPHTDTTWPESPEFAWKEFEAAGATGAEIDKITWVNATRFFDWDPFEHTPKEQATVGA